MINLQIKVNSVDVTDKVQLNSLQITSNVNQRKDTCAFSVVIHNAKTFYPDVNDEVEVFDGPDKIFGGVVLSYEMSNEVADLATVKITCTDYSRFMDRKLVLERFENMTVGDIIAYMISVYAPTFTDNNVIGTRTVTSIAFNRITMSEAIQKIADQIGYSWYVDQNRDIHFFPRSEELAPFNLTDDSGTFIWKSLVVKDDMSQLRNAVYVEGGEAKGNTRTETFIAPTDDDERKIYRLANKFAELPLVKVNGVTKTVGVDFLDNEADFDAMWSFQQKYIKFTTGNEPSAGQTVEVTGDPLFPIIIRIQSTISVNEYGLYEFVIRDKTIRSRDEAKARALAELQSYQNGVVEGKFQTYDKGLRAGQVINLISAQKGLNESFMIQSVQFKMRTPTEGIWSVQLATLRTIGIIEFLRNLLKDNEIIDGESDTLLTFLQFQDAAVCSDELTAISATQPPYIWLSNNPAEDASVIAASGGRPPIRWNLFTWAA